MNDNRTWLASVLFMDIVSYSKTDVNHQLQVKLHFQNIVASEINALEEDNTIRLDTGDGMAISYLGDPEKVYPIARKLRERFSALKNDAEYNYEVRMGLNLGPIKVVDDLNQKRNCIGSGVNDAERVMSFAGGNQLFVSRSYFDIVSKVSQQYSNELNHVGLRSDKHDQQHDVYELVVDVVQASDFSPSASHDDLRSASIDAAVNHDHQEKFDSAVIERISNEYIKYIGRDKAQEIIQQSIQTSGTVYDLCSLLLDAIISSDDRYSFDQFLKSCGYHGYN